MEIIRVRIADVKSDPFGLKNENRGFFIKIKQVLKARSLYGCYSNELKDAAFLRRKLKSKCSKRYEKYVLIKYFFGDSITKRIIPNSDYANALVYDDLQNKIIEYRNASHLYHFTPLVNLDSIMKNGIKVSNRFVFLTTSDNLIGYLRWKTIESDKDMDFCKLKIDAKQLAKKRKLFFYKYGEVITEYVEPEFITII